MSPNNFGGDQLHPSYMPQEIPDNWIQGHNQIWRIDIERYRVDWEHVNGEQQTFSLDFAGLPDEVKTRIKGLLKQVKK
jgi:hypothetical protein